MANQSTVKKIENLKGKLKEAKALAARQDAIAKTNELLKLGKESKNDETRKKILIGAYIMSRMSDPLELGKRDDGECSFEQWLKRDEDRALFGLKPLPPIVNTD